MNLHQTAVLIIFMCFLMCILYSVNPYLRQSCIVYAPSIRYNTGTEVGLPSAKSSLTPVHVGSPQSTAKSMGIGQCLYCQFLKCLIKFSLFICLVFWKSSLHGDHRTSFCLCLLAVSSVVHFCSQMSLLDGCVTFCVVFSFLFSDVEVCKEGLLCTRIFHRCRKQGYYD